MKIIQTHLDAGDKLGAQVPEIIVVHAMGEFINGDGWRDHAVQFLRTAKPYPLSAHSLVAPDGTNYRCRLDTECAYHAGGYNKNTLGIECLVAGEHNYGSFVSTISKPYLANDQYNEVVRQAREWLELWPIKKIVRHSDLSPERKVDPGDGFPWQDFLNDVGMP